MEHTMATVGNAQIGKCISCGGYWVKNKNINPYNRNPNWVTESGEYQTLLCSGKNVQADHREECNCKQCLHFS